MSIEAMKLAFRALERVSTVDDDHDILPPSLTDAVEEAIDVLKEALAKQEQCKYPNCDYPCMNLPDCREQGEPVAWMVWGDKNVPVLTFTKPADKYVFDALYTTPPQRTWVGLTDDECRLTYTSAMEAPVRDQVTVCRAIEAKLRSKNERL